MLRLNRGARVCIACRVGDVRERAVQRSTTTDRLYRPAPLSVKQNRDPEQGGAVGAVRSCDSAHPQGQSPARACAAPSDDGDARVSSFRAHGRAWKEWFMAAPYSQDLRDRVLRAYDRGMKTKQIAETFGVSSSLARRVKQRRRETGETAQPVQPQAPARCRTHRISRRPRGLPATLQPRPESDRVGVQQDDAIAVKPGCTHPRHPVEHHAERSRCCHRQRFNQLLATRRIHATKRLKPR